MVLNSKKIFFEIFLNWENPIQEQNNKSLKKQKYQLHLKEKFGTNRLEFILDKPNVYAIK
jgi:hypothetical protein